MDTPRRWLIVFGSIIAALVVATVGLVLFTGNGQADMLPEDTPQGIVQRYLLALQQQDYPQAYDYLVFDPGEGIKSYEDWLRFSAGYPTPGGQRTWKATLGDIIEDGSTASVNVYIDTFRPSGPFEDPVNRQDMVFQLTRTPAGWRITSPIYVYWNY
jgi:hypothetical protein